MREEENLQALGRKTEYRDDYAPEVLETFENKHPDNDYWVRFNCPEFTSLCPITGQPDFAEIRISYLPGRRMVESKSLKLYLFSFRNHGDFHEDCVNVILKDLVRLMDPKYIEVTGLFTPRGGISIYPFAFCRAVWALLGLFAKRGEYLSNTLNNNGYGIMHRRECIFPLGEIEFEGKRFRAPADPDAYLRDLYGNYMELPPVEKELRSRTLTIGSLESGSVSGVCSIRPLSSSAGATAQNLSRSSRRMAMSMSSSQGMNPP